MESKKKIKILFVLSQLVQHGSERYLFEICKALDKNHFQVEVMTRKFFVKNHFYYDKLLALNIPVHTKLISRRHLRFPIKKLYNKLSFLKKTIDWLHRLIIKYSYKNFFESYDIIAVIGIETYCDALMPFLDKNNNVIIHHVNHQHQFSRNYFNECPQNKIVVCDKQQEKEIMLSKLSHATLFRFPLLMDLSERPDLNRRSNEIKGPIRIGVVSRLFPDRPNEPLLKCFHALLQQTDANLFFYGSGNTKLYDTLLDDLKIRDKVHFMGHQQDLEYTIQRDSLSLLWLTSMGVSISYGSIEIASLGVPMIFWDLSSMTYKQILDETEGAMHCFSDMNQFVLFNMKVLNNSNELKILGFKLRKFVCQKFEIANYIESLQSFYKQVADESN